MQGFLYYNINLAFPNSCFHIYYSIYEYVTHGPICRLSGLDTMKAWRLSAAIITHNCFSEHCFRLSDSHFVKDYFGVSAQRNF